MGIGELQGQTRFTKFASEPFSLEWTGEKTRLTIRHEHFYSETAYKHANFFWGFALTDVQKLLER